LKSEKRNKVVYEDTRKENKTGKQERQRKNESDKAIMHWCGSKIKM
jgi:hypothetical protein